jgi:hypothetical protein
MSFVVTETKGIRITRVTRGDVKDYWLCRLLENGKEEKYTEWEDVLAFIKRNGR